MKTAMKKLFSLVLVAVLLIGVMPFQAFADGEVDYTIYDAGNGDAYVDEGTLNANQSYDPYKLVPKNYTFVTMYCFVNDNFERSISGPFDAEIGKTYALYVQAKSEPEHTHSHSLTASTAPTCTVAGSETYTCSCGDTYTNSIDALGHGTANEEGKCPTCGICLTCMKDPCECTATVKVQINNTIYDGSFSVAAGKNADEVYAAYKSSSLAALREGVHGPIVTEADMVTRIGTTAANQTYYLWLSWEESEDDDDSDTTTAKCAKCEGPLTKFGDCAACELDQLSCTCGQTAAPEDNTGKVKLTLDYNYPGSTDSIQYVDRNSNLLNVIAGLPAPTRDGYLFDRWTLDERGNETIGRNDYVSNRGTTKIYAQWTKQVQVVNYGIDIHLNLNYDRKWGETVKSVAVGTRMGDVLDYVDEPVRRGYKFAGWYWDANCKNDVERNDKVQGSNKGYQTIYAKWVKKNYEHEVLLKIYLNGNTESAVKVIDLDAYVRDGKFTRYEASQIVSQYYEAKSSKDDMDVDGLFTSTTWNHGRYSMRNAEEVIHVNDKEDVVFFVMVRDAQRISSKTSVADSTNPKTGDMIFTAATVLVASASCLAALYYLNKKRAY